MGKVMINHGRSVPLTFRFVGVVFVVIAIFLVMENLSETMAVLLSILLSLLIPMLWFSSEILTIDTDLGLIHSGNWVMGYKTGKPRKFNEIEKIYINQVRTSQKMYSQANLGYTLKGIEYHAYIKLDDGEKYFLTSHSNEKKLEEMVDGIKKKLGIK